MNDYSRILKIMAEITKKINKCPRCKSRALKKKYMCDDHAREEQDLLSCAGFRIAR